MTFETVCLTEFDDRLVVELHRPQARNAINAAMIAELHDICVMLERCPRMLLLTGSGQDFAAGAEIGELCERGVARKLSRESTGRYSTESRGCRFPRWLPSRAMHSAGEPS